MSGVESVLVVIIMVLMVAAFILLSFYVLYLAFVVLPDSYDINDINLDDDFWDK